MRYCTLYERTYPSGKVSYGYKEKDPATGRWKGWKVCPTYVKDRKQAVAFVDIRNADLAKQAMSADYGIPMQTTEQKVLTLKAFLDWDNARPDIAPTTRNVEKALAKSILAGLGESVRVNEVTTAMLDQYVRLRVDEGKQPRTINMHLQLLKAAFNRGVAKGRLSKVPCKMIAKLPEPNKKERALTQAEASALLAAILKHDNELEPDKYKKPDSQKKRQAKQKLHDTVTVLLYSGLRKGEVFRMRWQDVDLDNGTLTVTSLKRGGGGEGHTDVVDLSPVVLEVLTRRYRETAPDHSELVFGIAPEDRGKIYNGMTPKKRGTVKGVDCFEDYRLRSKVKRFAKLAGIKWHKQLRVHDLRHTFCTELARTVPLAVVKDLARHRDLKTTLRYVHPGREAMKKAIHGLTYAPNVVDMPGREEPRADNPVVEQAEAKSEAV